jgi:DNA-directed RNA polymerase
MLSKAELVNLQIQIELDGKAQSIEKARKADERLKSKGQNSKSQAGLALHGQIISSAISLMAEDINYHHRTLSGALPVCYKLLLDNERVAPFIEPEEMAHIALVTMLDSVKDIPTIPSTRIFTEIGSKIEDQARITKVKELDPKFFERLASSHLMRMESYSKKMSKAIAEIEFREIDKRELAWDGWSLEERVAIGAWAAWIIQQSTDWFQEVQLPPCKADPFGTTKYLMFTKKALKEAEALEDMRMKLSYECRPMFCDPKPFTTDPKEDGGYIVKAPGMNSKLIHGHDTGSLPSQMAVDFLNNLQIQKFEVNGFVLEILEHLSRDNTSIGTFHSYIGKRSDHVPKLDPDVWLLPDTDERKKKAFVVLMKLISEDDKHKEKALTPKQILSLARWAIDHGLEFTSPWFFDTRLRAYPTSNFHPQGADFQKALLLFANGTPVTRKNKDEIDLIYKIALANTYGNSIDKRPFYGPESRVSWATSYIEENIFKILNKPCSEASQAIWTEADEPFQHIALLHEYNKVIRNWRPGVLCQVPIGYDATCSGLQLLGSFVKDEETCRLVNVLPSDRPQDAYRAVAKRAVEILSDPERWTQLRGREKDTEHGIPLDKVNRSVAKKVVMLIPYGGTYDTLVKHVGIATEDWKLGMRDLHTLTKALIQGMAEAVPGFSALNKWFKEAAACVMASDADCIQWTTPTGSHIEQRYFIPKTHKIATIAFGISNYKDPDHYGSTQATVVDTSVKGEVNKRKNQTALAANWTHSMDAAVLQQAFHDFDQPFTTVHDCLYAPAANIPAAVKRIREAFVKVTSHQSLQQFIEDNQITFPLPPIGNADVSSAINSDYLFS